MVTRQNGFTLVEIMVAIAIIGLLAVVAAPYTASWVHEAQVGEARTVLSRAYSHAKSVALRNPDGEEENTVVASVLLRDGILLVCQGKPTCDKGSAVWQHSWPTDVALSLKVDGNSVTSLALNNRGQILDESSPPSPINQGLAFTLSKGSVTQVFPEVKDEDA